MRHRTKSAALHRWGRIPETNPPSKILARRFVGTAGLGSEVLKGGTRGRAVGHEAKRVMLHTNPWVSAIVEGRGVELQIKDSNLTECRGLGISSDWVSLGHRLHYIAALTRAFGHLHHSDPTTPARRKCGGSVTAERTRRDGTVCWGTGEWRFGARLLFVGERCCTELENLRRGIPLVTRALLPAGLIHNGAEG